MDLTCKASIRELAAITSKNDSASAACSRKKIAKKHEDLVTSTGVHGPLLQDCGLTMNNAKSMPWFFVSPQQFLSIVSEECHSMRRLLSHALSVSMTTVLTMMIYCDETTPGTILNQDQPKTPCVIGGV